MRVGTILLATILVGVTAAGCGDDDDDSRAEQAEGGESGSAGKGSSAAGKSSSPSKGGTDGDPTGVGGVDVSAGAGGGASEPQPDPIYLMQLAIYAPDETLNYVLLSNELDFNVDVARLDTAREFPGYTGITVINGQVVAADGGAPFIRKYQINDDLSWKELGKLNFSAYPMDEWNYMNFYFQAIKQDDVYFFYGADKSSRVHWNATDWKIVKAHQDTQLPLPEAGFTLTNGGNRTGIRDYAGPVVQPFAMSEDATGNPTENSWLAVYDEKDHTEKAVLEVPCPGLQQATKDEDGNLYFSTTFHMPTLALYGQGPAPCVVKVKADGTLDKSFKPNDLRGWTNGHYGVNFRYLSGGKAIANVLHEERLTDVDWDGEIDQATEAKIGGVWVGEDYMPVDPTLWEIHLIDLEAGTSQVVSEGFAAEHDLGNYTTYTQIDGRTFITVQLDTETTKSAIYELDLDTATVTPVGEMEGDLWGVERVR